LHRHEFSAPLDPCSTTAPNRSSLARSAFSAPIPWRASTYERPSPSPVANQPWRPLSEIAPRNTEPVIRCQGPEMETMTEDARSVANSETSEGTSGGSSRRRRILQTSTIFHLAHPAPTLTQKQRLIHIRPRLLLQLQRLSPDSRPEPAMDVLHSAVVIPRLAQKFSRMFRRKAELGVNDVMIVQSEEYDSLDASTTEAAESDEENLANRQLLAVICQMPNNAGGSRGKARIVLSDSSVWVASPLPNGLYEFVTFDENGNKTTARWMKRSTSRCSSADFPNATFSHNGFKYAFSIIDPNSRRHPIMGSLTQNTLDIPDFYTSVSTSVKEHHPTTHLRPFLGEPDSMDDEPAPERTTHAVDADTKKLIQVTGIWVALREGLSPYFRYNDSMGNPSHGRARSVSLTTDAKRPILSGTGTSTPDSWNNPPAGVGGKIRRARPSVPAPATPSPQFDGLAVPTRSASAGTAFMQRITARRTRRPSSTVLSDSNAESVLRRRRHSMTEYGNIATLPSLALSGSSITTPDTSKRPQRQVLSAYIPSARPHIEHTPDPAASHRAEVLNGGEDLEWTEKPKTRRWKDFSNLFRRQTRCA
jgi:hypothetical protein